jgi:hypothetical protein
MREPRAVSQSNPAEVFESLRKDFFAAVREDRKMAEIFERIQKFKAPFNTSEDAKRLLKLKERGAERLGIKVGTLPLAIGPGLAFMYDVALEAIRANPKRINSKMLRSRALRTAEGLFDVALLKVGSSTVTALEQALADKNYADRLRHRADELKWVARDNFDPGPCEHCTVTYEDKETGEFITTCPSQSECEQIGGLLLLLLLAWLVYEIIDWLWD